MNLIERRGGLVLTAVVLSVLMGSSAAAQELSRDERALMAEELLNAEPTAEEVRERALHYYAFHREDIHEIRRSLRSKGGVPYFVVSERYQNSSLDRTLQGVAQGTEVELNDYRDDLTTHRSSTVGIMSWDLPTTVMTDSEFQTYQLAVVNRQIIRTVNSWYYSRRALLLELLVDPPRSPRGMTTLRLRVEGFTALIDIYTGGWFSRQLPPIPAALRPDSAGASARFGREEER